jgi:hypothetical protein
MQVYRLEFLQPDGRWAGPYFAEYMTEAAFTIRARMGPRHKVCRPAPDPRIFLASPGWNGYVCGSPSMRALLGWFGRYLRALMREGGHIAVYTVPDAAVAWRDEQQIVYQQRQAVCVHRTGTPPAAPLVLRKLVQSRTATP